MITCITIAIVLILAVWLSPTAAWTYPVQQRLLEAIAERRNYSERPEVLFYRTALMETLISRKTSFLNWIRNDSSPMKRISFSTESSRTSFRIAFRMKLIELSARKRPIRKWYGR